ncbi:MAG: cupin-like domain-containing protein [Gammaproteobacteria bacterium]|nr:cupin-like domain-containing protein [Gammaproteobacteria bacterium]
MPADLASVRELAAADAGAWREAVLGSDEPLVLRGLVSQWPLVRAGRESMAAALTYLRGFYRDATVGAWFGPPAINGRFFYNEDFTGFNYQPAMVKLDAVFAQLEQHEHAARPPAVYVGSTTIDTCLPGMRAANEVSGLPADALASIWLGNRTRIAAHYDMPDNLACVAVGRRRFTLFPPAELPNLYVGPLDFTPAGQQVSLVDFAAPDYAEFPRFAEALTRASVAELEAGDALYIPGMWWHHVEALEACNVLVNYWWQRVPAYAGAPASALLQGLLGLRPLPRAQRAAWREILEHYVFADGDAAIAHIPARARGVLGALDEQRARALRALLLRQLNR